MPKRPHIHSEKFRRCVKKVSESRYDGRVYNPYAVCMASVKKPLLSRHKRTGKMPRKAIEKMLKNPRTPKGLKAYWKKQLGEVI
jgi:hypothetical protein